MIIIARNHFYIFSLKANDDHYSNYRDLRKPYEKILQYITTIGN